MTTTKKPKLEKLSTAEWTQNESEKLTVERFNLAIEFDVEGLDCAEQYLCDILLDSIRDTVENEMNRDGHLLRVRVTLVSRKNL